MVQSSGTNEASDKDEIMPQYMQKFGAGYRFRRAIPQALRSILGKREFKTSLGSDFKEACRLARLQATLSDEQMLRAQGEHEKLKQARSKLLYGFDKLTPITEITEELKQQLHAYWIAVVDTSDQSRRADGFDQIEDVEAFKANALAMQAKLKSDWSSGNVTPYLAPLRETLFLRGYRLDVSSSDERKLALQYLRALMAGYDLLLARDAGHDPAIQLTASPLPEGKQFIAISSVDKKTTNKEKRTTILQLFDHWNAPSEKRPLKTIEGVRQHIEDFIRISKKQFADEILKEDFNAYVQARNRMLKNKFVHHAKPIFRQFQLLI